MKNRLSDLNNHLFAQLERLGEESLTPERIEQEAQRADAIVAVADQVIRNASLQLQAVKLLADHGDRFKTALQPMLATAATPPDQPATTGAAPAITEQSE